MNTIEASDCENALEVLRYIEQSNDESLDDIKQQVKQIQQKADSPLPLDWDISRQRGEVVRKRILSAYNELKQVDQDLLRTQDGGSNESIKASCENIETVFTKLGLIGERIDCELPVNWDISRQRGEEIHNILVVAFKVLENVNREFLYENDIQSDQAVGLAYMKLEEALAMFEGNPDPRRGGLNE